MRPKNIFTVDLEDWYHANYRQTENSFSRQASTVEVPTLKLLDLLRKSDNKATFFCLGSVAQGHPDLIREILRQGHEIASHGFSHRLVYLQTIEEFEEDLKKSTTVLQNIIGERPVGYRAPSWSVDRKRTEWFWKVLEDHGYRYSSSLFPLRTFLYGDSSAPRFKHKIGSLLEIPPSTIAFFGQRMAFSGGFYLRLIPTPFLKLATRIINSRREPVVFYIHPREVDPNGPEIGGLNYRERFIHYYNVKNTYSKIEKIFESYKTCSIRDYFQL
jgi:polysaccharide deacetylase family protein (PEP-CTERM system associated)